MTAADDGVTDGTVGPVAGGFEVGVAVYGSAEGAASGEERVPGYDEASGSRSWGRHVREHRSVVVEKGEEAVRVATEAIADQIGLAAARIAVSLDQSAVGSGAPGRLGLESVEVSFGITFEAGVQALFTATSESSVQVTVTLARRPDPAPTSLPASTPSGP